MPTAQTTLPGLPSSVPTARRFTESLLVGWGLADAGWTAAQIVSELATNCALHANTDFTLTVTADDDQVRLEIQDRSSATVQPRPYSTTATTGRGLRLVEMLSSAWGVIPGETGKTIWVLILLDGMTGGELEDDALLSAYESTRESTQEGSWEGAREDTRVVPLQPVPPTRDGSTVALRWRAA